MMLFLNFFYDSVAFGEMHFVCVCVCGSGNSVETQCFQWLSDISSYLEQLFSTALSARKEILQASQ